MKDLFYIENAKDMGFKKKQSYLLSDSVTLFSLMIPKRKRITFYDEILYFEMFAKCVIKKLENGQIKSAYFYEPYVFHESEISAIIDFTERLMKAANFKEMLDVNVKNTKKS